MSPARTTSRLGQARKAVRPALKARMEFSGPPGSGKTRTSLIVAAELVEAGRILVIDTEKESALTYADDFDFDHLPWHAPYDAQDLIACLRDAVSEYGVIVIDSFTHFWSGDGGILDKAGGNFGGWKQARPLHEAVVNEILSTDAHLILGVRAKVDHVQEVVDGRTKVRALGMADQQDSNLGYEMNVTFDIGMDHVATVTKTRTTVLPVGRKFGIEKTTELAHLYRDWLKGGEPPAPAAVIAGFRDRVKALPPESRSKCAAEFKGALGSPDTLRESLVDQAEALIASYEEKASGVPKAEEQNAPLEPVEDPTSSAPTASRTQEEGSADTSSPTEPLPEVTRAVDQHTPVTVKEAQRVHIVAKESGVDDVNLDILIYGATNGRSDSAKELTKAEQSALIHRLQSDNWRPSNWLDLCNKWAAWKEAQTAGVSL